MKKKLAECLLCGVMAASVLAGCGGFGGNSSTEAGTETKEDSGSKSDITLTLLWPVRTGYMMRRWNWTEVRGTGSHPVGLCGKALD